ncbi:ion channel DMI1 [Lujinxingia sediminis]|uniref:Ion channel DMI1 n=1 Tax=Lujinxingia sediminis TaxID=2480984 RepID=A0ABY0CV50_9DELT|nr:ion channel DMI1 [Lujinxingia sediminis]RVU45917.1 ion channel DMI1 [Lujinxingia sediminis]
MKFSFGLLDRLRFQVERALIRGPHIQLLVVAAVVALVALVGGLAVLPPDANGEGLEQSVWWAFLRLTDPGYLGDDQGAWRRVVATALTLAGYVLFMGTLVAIMTGWLLRSMRTLERGLTPVVMEDHFVVLGWTDRTVPLLQELLLSTFRVRHFLAGLGGGRRARIVTLVEELDEEILEEIRQDHVVGPRAAEVVLRSGSGINADHLRRVAAVHAAAVIVPSPQEQEPGEVSADVEVIKILLSLDGQVRAAGEPHPYVVIELQEPRHEEVARRAYGGPLEVVSSSQLIGRLMAQNMRHAGLSRVYNELLSPEIGSEVFIRHHDALAGKTFAEAARRFERATLCGVVRSTEGRFIPHLAPGPDFKLAAGDALVLIARTFRDAAPAEEPWRGAGRPLKRLSAEPLRELDHRGRRVLVLGWSEKVPALLTELGSYGAGAFEVTVVSSLPITDRLDRLRRQNLDLPERVCRHIEADYTHWGDEGAREIARADHVVFMSSDRLVSGEEADARTIMGYLSLEETLNLPRKRDRPPLQRLVELSDPHNQTLIGERVGEVMISPILLSHVLAQVALRRELSVVLDELFTAGGAEIAFRQLDEYALGPGMFGFEELEEEATRRAEVFLGVERLASAREGKGSAPGRALELNPERGRSWELAAHDRLAVMTRVARRPPAPEPRDEA